MAVVMQSNRRKNVVEQELGARFLAAETNRSSNKMWWAREKWYLFGGSISVVPLKKGKIAFASFFGLFPAMITFFPPFIRPKQQQQQQQKMTKCPFFGNQFTREFPMFVRCVSKTSFRIRSRIFPLKQII